jgi:hypothetical protein
MPTIQSTVCWYGMAGPEAASSARAEKHYDKTEAKCHCALKQGEMTSQVLDDVCHRTTEKGCSVAGDDPKLFIKLTQRAHAVSFNTILFNGQNGSCRCSNAAGLGSIQEKRQRLVVFDGNKQF